MVPYHPRYHPSTGRKDASRRAVGTSILAPLLLFVLALSGCADNIGDGPNGTSAPSVPPLEPVSVGDSTHIWTLERVAAPPNTARQYVYNGSNIGMRLVEGDQDTFYVAYSEESISLELARMGFPFAGRLQKGTGVPILRPDSDFLQLPMSEGDAWNTTWLGHPANVTARATGNDEIALYIDSPVRRDILVLERETGWPSEWYKVNGSVLEPVLGPAETQDSAPSYWSHDSATLLGVEWAGGGGRHVFQVPGWANTLLLHIRGECGAGNVKPFAVLPPENLHEDSYVYDEQCPIAVDKTESLHAVQGQWELVFASVGFSTTAKEMLYVDVEALDVQQFSTP